MEVEERLRAVAVVDEAVEGGEERDSVGNGSVIRIGMSLPALLGQSHPQRAEALLGTLLLRLAQRHRLDLGIPALGEVPQPLTVPPADDRDETAAVEDVEHHGHVAIAVPATRLEGPTEWSSSSRDRSGPERSSSRRTWRL